MEAGSSRSESGSHFPGDKSLLKLVLIYAIINAVSWSYFEWYTGNPPLNLFGCLSYFVLLNSMFFGTSSGIGGILALSGMGAVGQRRRFSWSIVLLVIGAVVVAIGLVDVWLLGIVWATC